jgi:hypothetical protein
MIRRALVLSWLLSLAAVACHRNSPSAGNGPGDAATGALPSPSSAQQPDAVAGARRAIQAWNDALNRHDAGGMEGLYDARVRFYGRDESRATVLKAKQSALSRDSTFTQQIEGPITISSGNAGELVATFVKRSGSAGKLSDVHATLTLREVEAGLPLIAEESDEASSHRHDDAGPADCETTAVRIVNALPEVKRAVANAKRAADQSGGRVTFGGLGPIYDGDSKFSAGLGVYNDQSFQEQVSYTVDHGRLNVEIMGAEQKVPPDALREIDRNCPH